MNQTIIRLATYLASPCRNIRLEVEAKRERLVRFFADYRKMTGQRLDFHTDGVVLLQDDADKWGLELRIYISDIANFPQEYDRYLTSNTRFEKKYQAYAARFNNNRLIMQLIRNGLRIGDS
jgi:hypothetical protein